MLLSFALTVILVTRLKSFKLYFACKPPFVQTSANPLLFEYVKVCLKPSA